MIRLATMKDRKVIFELAYSIYGKFMLEHGVVLVDEDLQNTVDQFIASKQNLVVEQDGEVCGMVAWVVTGHPANSKCKIFQEVLWCCKSKYKTDALLLLRGMEKRAKGADVVILGNLSEETEPQIRRIYRKMGYKYAESQYSKGRAQ